MLDNKHLLYIDYLKVIGLFLVILAHVDCPVVLMQMRSFDVPMLVFISGFLAARSYKPGNAIEYYWKRIKRLVFPAWIFLIIFFLVQTIIYTKPSCSDVVKAITFQRDANMVGMLWVIWVYFVCALCIPVIDKIGFTTKSVVYMSTIFIVFELVCATIELENNRIIYMTLMTVIPWGAVSFLGYYYDNISEKIKKRLAMGFAIVFLIIAILLFFQTASLVPTNEYKYPARLYYLSFAVSIIIVLIETIKRLHLPNAKLIRFISSSSLWIYLWHILVLYAVKIVIPNDNYWYLQYILIIIVSIFITWIQNNIVKRLMKSYEWQFLKVFLG